MTTSDQPGPNLDYKELQLPDVLSVDDTVKHMIFGDPTIGMSPLYNASRDRGPFIKALESEMEKLERLYRSTLRDRNLIPEILQVNFDRQEAMIEKAREYESRLESEITRAKENRSMSLVVDGPASEEAGIDMIKTDSASTWAKQAFDIDIGRIYIRKSGTSRADNDAGVEEVSETRQQPPDTSDSSHEEKHAHEEAMLVLVADALSRLLNMLEETDADNSDDEGPFGDNNGGINIDAIAGYIRDNALPEKTECSVISSTTGTRQPVSRKKTEITLFLLTKTLAELLDDAVKQGDLDLWQNREQDKKEKFTKSSRAFSSAPIQRYLSKYILLNESRTGQAKRAIQGRLNAAIKNTTAQDISGISEEDILDCLHSAAA
jgi:hypothetical protein